MVKQRWFMVSKRWLAIALVLILVLLGLGYGIGAYFNRVVLTSEELLMAALEKTLQSDSMRFNMVVKMGQAVISDVEGARVAPDSVHITGTMQDLPVEFIHVQDKTYLKGYWSDNWVCLEDNKIAQSELFVTEFNPLGNFNFKDVPVIKEVKNEVIQGVKHRVLEVHPMVQNSFMELNYSDFVYTIWVDIPGQMITKARIQATGKNSPRDQLEIVLELYDFDQQIKIVEPKID